MTGRAYDNPMNRGTFIGQTGPTVFFPKANAVDHYILDDGGNRFLMQRGSSQPNGYVACLQSRVDPDAWKDTLALLQPQDSCALAVA